MSPAPTKKGTRGVPGGGQGFGAAGSGGRRTPRPPAKRGRRGVPVQWVLVIVVLLAALVIGLLVQGSRSKAAQKPVNNPPAAVTGPGYSVLEGQRSAPVLVEEYGDFQCPVCKHFHQTMDPTIQKLIAAGTIRFAFHPLAFLDSGGDTESLRSASASVCAAVAGRFPEYHDVLYNNQSEKERSGFLTDSQLVEFAPDAGITGAKLDAFKTCVDGGRYEGWVQKGTKAASARGVTGTPTVYVDGHMLDASQYMSQATGDFDPAVFESTINSVAGSGTSG